MNPAIVAALVQWIITGLPELVAALNQGQQAKVTTTTTTIPPVSTVAGDSTGWPPPVAPGGEPLHDGGDEGVKLMQTFLVALGAQIKVDGFTGPATLGALNSLAAKLKAAGGGLA